MINITTNLDNVYDYSDTIQNYWRNQSGNTAILPNITSFKAVPDEEDKTLIHLTWDAATFETLVIMKLDALKTGNWMHV